MDLTKYFRLDNYSLFINQKFWFYDYNIRSGLNNVNLDFPSGTLTSLLGPSGCGKTTLLKIIAGLIESTEGEVRIRGKRINGPGPERAFVFQDFALLPWANTMRNVAFGLELRRVPKAQRLQIAKKHIDQVGLTGFENNHPGELLL